VKSTGGVIGSGGVGGIGGAANSGGSVGFGGTGGATTFGGATSFGGATNSGGTTVFTTTSGTAGDLHAVTEFITPDFSLCAVYSRRDHSDYPCWRHDRVSFARERFRP
jgi:hypothetical protein